MKTSVMLKEPPIAVLLGLPFHDVTLEETLAYCRKAMTGSESRYIVTANVDFTTQAYDDPDLRKIVFFADLVVCDGMPLVWLSRLFGYRLRERVAGSDMVPHLLQTCAQLRYPVYFLGSDLATLAEAKEIVEKRYSGLSVVGMDSPPIGAVVEWDNDALCEKMRVSGAKLLLVCLGCPKQERWIFANHKEAGIPLSIGVGASLDFITGKQKRAPRWMQKIGLEWFWRMASSPRRLAARYGHDFLFLIRASTKQALAQRKREQLGLKIQSEAPSEILKKPNVIHLMWEGSLENGMLLGAPVPEEITSDVLLDASRVIFMDSSGLGRLALLTRRCRNVGRSFVVIYPSRQFLHAIRSVRMDSLFPIVENEVQAFKILGQHEQKNVAVHQSSLEIIKVAFHHSLDALYHEEMLKALDQAMLDSPSAKSLVIDLEGVDFIDSRAVGGLIRARKQMAARGGELFLSGARPAVKDIITLLRLDKVLPEWKGESRA